jgi:predicted lipoprotein
MGRQSKGIPQPLQADAWRSQSSLKSLEASSRPPRPSGSGSTTRPARPAGQRPEGAGHKIDAAYAATLKLLADNQKTLGELLADDAGQQRSTRSTTA